MAHKLHIERLLAPLHPLTFLNTVEELPEALVTDGAGQRWLDGLSWEPIPCGTLNGESADGACDEHIFDDDLRRVCAEPLIQKPFRLNDAFLAATMLHNVLDIEARMAYWWNSGLSAAFAKELIDGALSAGHSLSEFAHAPTNLAFGSAAVSISKALAVLEEELGAQIGNRVGNIYLTPGLFATAIESYSLLQRNGRWETPVGNRVIVDVGFADAKAPGSESASASGSEWVYASGPVAYKMSLPTGLTGLSIRDNKVTSYVEGYGIIVFDNCPVTAALATYA